MPGGEAVHRVTLAAGPLRVALITFGAAIQSIDAPDRAGTPANVVLGLGTLDDYVRHSPHFGAVPGRYAGRIAGGRFTLDGVAYHLPRNDGGNTLHGGPDGFGKRAWSLLDHGPRHAAMGLDSPDGDNGFPGAMSARVHYSLNDASLTIRYEAETDGPTVVNLTNHSYFNLAGEGSGTIQGHRLTVNADAYAPISPDSIPTGELRAVDGTPFDFRAGRAIGEGLRDADPQIVRALGYDHGFVIAGSGAGSGADFGAGSEPREAASLLEPASGRLLTVLSTAPALQVYTGNMLTGSLAGLSGRTYRQGDGVCLEAQHLQDSPNKPGFPSVVLRPGQRFESTTVFRFGVGPR